MITSNSYLQIDLQAIKENIEQIRREIGPEVKLIPVLKANAYGLGAVTVGRFLSDLGEIDCFAVSQVASRGRGDTADPGDEPAAGHPGGGGSGT